MTGILIAVFLRGLCGTLNLDRTHWLVDPVGTCLIKGKKCFTAIINRQSCLSLPVTLQLVHTLQVALCIRTNSHQLLECQDAPSSTKAAKHFRKMGDWDISFLKPRSRCCYSTIWCYKCMSPLDLAVIDGSLTLP